MKNFGKILCSMKTIGFFHESQKTVHGLPESMKITRMYLKRKKNLSDSHQTSKTKKYPE
jgi:hypothetical protein